MQLPVTLSLQPSRRLALLVLAAHGGTLASIVFTSLDAWLKLIFLAAILLSAAAQMARLHGRRSIVRLTLHADGVLEYTRRGDESATVLIHLQSTVTPVLAVLLLKREKCLEALVVAPDALPCDDFRKLRLWLRWVAMKGNESAVLH